MRKTITQVLGMYERIKIKRKRERERAYVYS